MTALLHEVSPFARILSLLPMETTERSWRGEAEKCGGML